MIRKLAPYTKGYRVYILLGILCSAGEAVLELMLPKAMSNIVDYGIGGNGGAGDRTYILTMGLKMVLMALICLALGVGASAPTSVQRSTGRYSASPFPTSSTFPPPPSSPGSPTTSRRCR